MVLDIIAQAIRGMFSSVREMIFGLSESFGLIILVIIAAALGWVTINKLKELRYQIVVVAALITLVLLYA